MRFALIGFLVLVLSACSPVDNRTNPVRDMETPGSFRNIQTPSRSLSPIIAGWKDLPDALLNKKVDSFWQNHTGFPLIEKDPLYDDYLYITLIYRDNSSSAGVSFDIFGNYDDRNLGDKELKRLGRTDLFYQSYYMPADICFSYRFMLHDSENNITQTIADPLNPARIPTGELKDYSWSVLDLRPDEEDWYTKRYDSTKSQLITVDFPSKILDNTRKIFIYLPENFSTAYTTGYPVIYLFDSFIYLNRIEVPNVLDNMIREGLIEPMVAVFIDNPTKKTREVELPINFAFKEFIVNELVPYIRQNYPVSTDPKKTIIGGMSYGGLAAGFIGFYHDTLFGNILSQSGSFWRDYLPDNPSDYWYRADWLINKFQAEGKKDIRIFMDWGLQEAMILNSNRKLVKELDTLGYDYRFREFDGWHDWSNSRKTFPSGLRYLLNKTTETRKKQKSE